MLRLSGRWVSLIILVGLFGLSISFLGMVSRYVPPQASLDAAYYHVMAEQLENGKGFTEPFIWHFLNDYQEIEHPMDYWMPLGIVFYYFARLGIGSAGEVWVNIFIWALLSVLVFVEVKKITQKKSVAMFAFLTMLLSGRYLFYVLTTDNVAFYALFGFLFFKQLGSKNSSWHFTSIAGGAAALVRIEGLVIALVGGIFELHKTRSFKTIFGYFVVLLLILSPWMLRNQRVFSHPWPSNSRALFVSEYNDMFRRDVELNPASYISKGSKFIINQKLKGIWNSILNFIAAPGLLVMYPLWLVGLIVLWKSSGRYFASLLLFFILFCGLIVPVQAEKGSALHISAFFFPLFAVLGATGLGYLQNYFRMSARVCVLLILVLSVWALFTTYYSTVSLITEYTHNNGPYKSLLAKLSFAGRKVVSTDPVRVYYGTGASGVISSSVDPWEPVRLADDYACDTIIIDKRAIDYKPLPESVDWHEVASDTHLKVFFRKSDGKKK